VKRIPVGVYRELLVESLAGAVGMSGAQLEKILDSSDSGAKPASSGTQGHRAGSRSPREGRPSVVRHAITLVLNHPTAGERADVEKLVDVHRKGTDLLIALIETVQAEPNITTAGLLERFRHDEQGRHLGKLAATELPGDEEFDAAAELADCIDQLALAGRKDRIDFLIEKQKLSGLSDAEKAELRQLY
jgi:DNA primase